MCGGDGARPSTRTDSPRTWCRKIRRKCRGAPWRRSAPVPPHRRPRGRPRPPSATRGDAARRGAAPSTPSPSTPGREQLRPKVLRGGRRGPLRDGVERAATRCAAARSATIGGGIARTHRRCLYAAAHSPPPVVMGRTAAQRATRLRAPPRRPRRRAGENAPPRTPPDAPLRDGSAGHALARRGTRRAAGSRGVTGRHRAREGVNGLCVKHRASPEPAAERCGAWLRGADASRPSQLAPHAGGSPEGRRRCLCHASTPRAARDAG